MPDLARRDFLKALAATAVSLGLDPFRGVTVDKDEYLNRRLGLRLRKPPAWEFESIADFAALRDRTALQSQLGDEPHPLKDPTNLPVFIFADPRYRQGDFGPAIILYDEALRYGVPDDELVAHRRMIANLSLSYRNVEVLEEPRQIRLLGENGTETVWRYLHELDDGQCYALKIRSLLVFRPPRVHTYYLADSAVDEYVPKATFDAFLGTIEYDAL